MNSLTRIMSYDKTKLLNQENYCFECKPTLNQTLIENEIEKIVSERYSDKDEKTKIFIRKALKVHGDRYDYSKTVYIKATEKIEIVCRIEGHGSFWQTPNNHLRNRNCKKCTNEKLAFERKFTNEEFIEKAREIHNNKYNYSKVNYINNNTKIIIICHNHKKPYKFLQKPSHHLNGHGCKKCADKNLANKKLKSLREFIEKANKIHGEGRYDYSKVKYIGNKENIIIICPKHGEFLQTPANHLKGQNCPKCKSSKGEIAVRKFLIENNIEFEEQKKFKNCKDLNSLPFDFYIPQYNLCIEFDGIQHFKPIKRGKKMTDNQAEEIFKYIQKHDQIKNEYCKKNRINLLRLNDIKNINEKITKYLLDD